MKIAIITNAIAPDKVGGSETQTLALARELGKRNAVHVLVRRTAGLPEVEKKEGFVISRLGRESAFPLPLFRFSGSVLRAIQKDRKNVSCILAKTVENGLVGIVAGRLLRLPVAVLIEGEKEYRTKNLRKLLMLKLVSKSARLLVQTAGIREEVFQKTGNRPAVVPNGVPARLERAGGDKVIYVGRLIRDGINDKGVRFLVEAVKGTDIGTIIVGSGPEREALMVRAAGSMNIDFVGGVPPEKVPAYLLQGFVLVVPSIYGEGLPNVILEAFSVGLPVIAAATGGIPDIVEHGRTGFLIPPGNPWEIRRHIELLRNDRAMQQRMTENCRKEAGKYSWEKTALRFEEMLRLTEREKFYPGNR